MNEYVRRGVLNIALVLLVTSISVFAAGEALARTLLTSNGCQSTAKTGEPMIDCDEDIECDDASDSCNRKRTADYWSMGTHYREYSCSCKLAATIACTAHDRWRQDGAAWTFVGTMCTGTCSGGMCQENGDHTCSCQ
jgi:hypothetical protein